MEEGTGAFYLNSKTRFADIRDGLSNTIFYGEKTSGIKTHNSVIVDDDFYPTWSGVFKGAKLPLWRIVAWGQDTLNHTGKQHDYSVYSSKHSQVAVFAFGDGAVIPVANTIEIEVFRHLNTIRGKEVISLDSFK